MEFELDAVARREADEVEPVLPGGAGDAAVAVGQFDAVSAVLEDFDHDAPGLDLVGVHGRKFEGRR